jgi:hypothetical protein
MPLDRILTGWDGLEAIWICVEFFYYFLIYFYCFIKFEKNSNFFLNFTGGVGSVLSGTGFIIFQRV